MDAAGTTTLSPALDHIIERPRLITLLEEGDARVILLAAPAGYGKTTLARQWSARQTGPVAWHRTTRASGDVAALAVALDELLNTAVQQPKRDPRRIAAIASVNARPQPLARALVSTYASLTADVLLVLDEWDAADTAEADELLAHLVDELDIRFLITSRTRPPWFTSRLTVYGEGLEIGIDELTMTDQEALAVLSVVQSPPNPQSLVATARGWPAVLGLAAMTSRDVPRRLVPGMLYDFLATELVESTKQEVQHGVALMAAAAIGDIATARLVLGERADAILRSATERGLAIRDGDHAVSVHPLLRDLLIARLRDLDPSSRDKVLKRLSVLVASEKWDEALAVAEAIPDADFISHALQRALDELLRVGRVETLRRWVTVGTLAGANGAILDYVDGEAASRLGDYYRALIVADRAAQQLEGDLSARAHLVAARAAHLAERAEQSRSHAKAACELSQSPATKAAALWAMFTEAIDDERVEAQSILDAFREIELDSSERVLRAAQGSLLLGSLGGNLETPLEDAEVACSALEPGVEPLVQTSFLNAYSHALATCARYDAALDAAEKGDNLANEHGLEFVRRYALINKARALIGLRRFSLATRTLAALRRDLRSTPDPYIEVHLSIQSAGLYLSMGDADRARAALLLDVTQRLCKGVTAEHLAMHALVSAIHADIRCARREAVTARDISQLQEVRAITATAEAVSALKEHIEEDATNALSDVLHSGALDALVLGLRACPELATHLVSLIGREELSALFLRSNDASLARRLGMAIPRSTLRSEALSPRELEIHGLLSQGMTNQEISGLLYISESTTKVHVRHILDKLGVRSRVEAARVWPETNTAD